MLPASACLLLLCCSCYALAYRAKAPVGLFRGRTRLADTKLVDESSSAGAGSAAESPKQGIHLTWNAAVNASTVVKEVRF